MSAGSKGLWQNPNADVFELDRGAFGFEAEVAVRRLAVGAAGDFLAVDPEADLTIDGADIVVIPFIDAFGEPFGGKAAASIGSDGWEGFHFGRAGGEDVAV